MHLQVAVQRQLQQQQQLPPREGKRQRSVSPRSRTSHSASRRNMHEMLARSFRTGNKQRTVPLPAPDNSISGTSRHRHGVRFCVCVQTDLDPKHARMSLRSDP